MTTKGAVIIDNRPGVDEVIARHEKFLPKDWAIIHLKPSISTIQDYNNFLVSEYLWQGMPDVVLIFQQDSGLLRGGIEDFMQFPYIGAPIPKIGWPAMNGGLSLRNREAMLHVIRSIPYMGGNEDCWFCNGLHQLGYVLPDYDMAKGFSVESSFHLGSVGYHAIDAWLTHEQCEQIRSQYD